MILEVLRPSFEAYDLAFLAEESEDDQSRLEKDYFWCIDPLDGTLPFTQGIPGYAVSIALVSREGLPVIGVIYDPVEGKLFQSVKGGGIRIDGQYLDQNPLKENDELTVCFDCSFPTDPDQGFLTESVQRFAEEQGYSAANIHLGGGAVMNACYVLLHPPALYFKRPKEQLGGGCFGILLQRPVCLMKWVYTLELFQVNRWS